MFSKKYKELTTGIIFATVAILYLIGSVFIKKNEAVVIGAEFMPRIYGFILLAVSCVEILHGISVAKTYKGDTSEKEEKDMKNVVITMISIILYIVLMQYVGFIITSIVLLFVLCNLLTPNDTKKKYVVYAVFSIVLPIAVYILFKKYMNVSLPLGVFFGG